MTRSGRPWAGRLPPTRTPRCALRPSVIPRTTPRALCPPPLRRRRNLRPVQGHVSQAHQVQFQRQAHRLLEQLLKLRAEAPPKVAEHLVINAQLVRQPHEPGVVPEPLRHAERVLDHPPRKPARTSHREDPLALGGRNREELGRDAPGGVDLARLRERDRLHEVVAPFRSSTTTLISTSRVARRNGAPCPGDDWGDAPAAKARHRQYVKRKPGRNMDALLAGSSKYTRKEVPKIVFVDPSRGPLFRQLHLS